MAAARTVTVFAPAKINLTLHVTGQRDDGYHVLDSLVVFADVGDRVEVRASDSLDLTVEGPEAAEVPADGGNLVLKVAQLFDDLPGAAIRLAKELPVASGIGGGSSDAAATVRALSCLSDGQQSARTDMQDALLPLGADIPPGKGVSQSAMRLADEIGQAPVIVLLCSTERGPGAMGSVIPAAQNLLLAARACGIGGTNFGLAPSLEFGGKIAYQKCFPF